MPRRVRDETLAACASAETGAARGPCGAGGGRRRRHRPDGQRAGRRSRPALAPTPELLRPGRRAAARASTSPTSTSPTGRPSPAPVHRFAGRCGPAALARCCRPVLVRLDSAGRRSPGPRWSAAASTTASTPASDVGGCGCVRRSFLVVVLAGWVVMSARRSSPAGPPSGCCYGPAGADLRPAPAAGLDYYDRELAGRIMTRMTTRRRGAHAAAPDRPHHRRSSPLVTFVGVGRRVLSCMDAALALVDADRSLPPLVVATVVFRRRVERGLRPRPASAIATVNADLQESLSGVRVAQAFVREEPQQRRLRRVATRLPRRRGSSAQQLVALYFPFVELLSEIGHRARARRRRRAGRATATLTPGALIAFLLYLNLFFSPIQQLSQVFDTYQQAQRRAGPDRRAAATPTVDARSAADPVDPAAAAGRDRVRRTCTSPTADASAPRRCAGVDLTHRSRARRWRSWARRAPASRRSSSSSPASTTRPSGRVLVDGIDRPRPRPRPVPAPARRRAPGGVPVRRHDPRTTSPTAGPTRPTPRSRPRPGPSAPTTSSPGCPAATSTPVSERGRSLSSGQRQLIALARARLVDPAILLLDEATSNLDLATEAAGRRAMGAVAEGRTTLVIAHRLPTAARADRIVVIDDGRVVELGSHADLLAAGGPTPPCGPATWAMASPPRATGKRRAAAAGREPTPRALPRRDRGCLTGRAHARSTRR